MCNIWGLENTKTVVKSFKFQSRLKTTTAQCKGKKNISTVQALFSAQSNTKYIATDARLNIKHSCGGKCVTTKLQLEVDFYYNLFGNFKCVRSNL